MRDVVGSVIRVLCTTTMGITAVATCWQVTTRYILNNPSTVTEEALRYLLMWAIMVGAVYVYGKRKQLSINILLKEVSPSVQETMDIGAQCLVIALCIVAMVIESLRLCATAADRSSVTLGIPMSYIYSCLLVDTVLFIFYALIFIEKNMRELRDNRGQLTAEHPIAEQESPLHLAGIPENENGRNDIS